MSPGLSPCLEATQAVADGLRARPCPHWTRVHTSPVHTGPVHISPVYTGPVSTPTPYPHWPPALSTVAPCPHWTPALSTLALSTPVPCPHHPSPYQPGVHTGPIHTAPVRTSPVYTSPVYTSRIHTSPIHTGPISKGWIFQLMKNLVSVGRISARQGSKSTGLIHRTDDRSRVTHRLSEAVRLGLSGDAAHACPEGGDGCGSSPVGRWDRHVPCRRTQVSSQLNTHTP